MSWYWFVATLVHYNTNTDILSTYHHDKSTHILDHIQEWRRRKWLIKATIPLEFMLEWFLKSLLSYFLMDVSTSGVMTEEEAIFKSQQLDIIYAQFWMLCDHLTHIFPYIEEASRLIV
jgi:hypothetical protein